MNTTEFLNLYYKESYTFLLRMYSLILIQLLTLITREIKQLQTGLEDLVPFTKIPYISPTTTLKDKYILHTLFSYQTSVPDSWEDLDRIYLRVNNKFKSLGWTPTIQANNRVPTRNKLYYWKEVNTYSIKDVHWAEKRVVLGVGPTKNYKFLNIGPLTENRESSGTSLTCYVSISSLLDKLGLPKEIVSLNLLRSDIPLEKLLLTHFSSMFGSTNRRIFKVATENDVISENNPNIINDMMSILLTKQVPEQVWSEVIKIAENYRKVVL